jgi:hypothetical protein
VLPSDGCREHARSGDVDVIPVEIYELEVIVAGEQPERAGVAHAFTIGIFVRDI